MRGSLQGGLWALILGVTGLGVASIVSEEPANNSGQVAATVSDTAVAEDVTVAEATALEEVPAQQPPAQAAQAPASTEETPAVAPDVFDTQDARLTLATVQNLPNSPVGENGWRVRTAPDAPVVRARLQALTARPADPSPEITTSPVLIITTVNRTPPTVQQQAVAPQEPATTDTFLLETVADTAPKLDSPEILVLDAPETPINPSVTVTAEVLAPVTDTPAADQPLVTNTATDVTPLIVSEDPTNAQEDAAVSEDLAQPEVETPNADGVAATAGAPNPGSDESGDTVVATEDAFPEPVETDEVVEVAPEVADDTSTASVGGPVRVNRPGETPSTPIGQDATLITEEEADEVQPALVTYAATFENLDNLPLIAFVLVDQADAPPLSAGLGPLGYRPTVAINALGQDAADRMKAYRAAGAEIAMEVALPRGAQPTDVEVAFEAAFGIVPEAAMLFSSGNGVLQNNRTVALQVMNVLAEEGRGYVTVQRGLDSTVRLAEEASVPAIPVERVLAADASPNTLKRTLDQVAFRARQDGGAVIVAPMTETMLDVLAEWLQALDPETLRPAPVSALLLPDDAAQ